ncbi:hypothetical protein AB2E72_09120 [Escherichia coli]|jgi:hypothetical protein|nr:hypothetical protein HMPREF9530_05056 [Escherichia coli MS 21-1]
MVIVLVVAMGKVVTVFIPLHSRDAPFSHTKKMVDVLYSSTTKGSQDG